MSSILNQLRKISAKLDALMKDNRPLSEKGLIVTHYINVDGLSPKQAEEEIGWFIKDYSDIGDNDQAAKTFKYYKEYFKPVTNQPTKTEIIII